MVKEMCKAWFVAMLLFICVPATAQKYGYKCTCTQQPQRNGQSLTNYLPGKYFNITLYGHNDWRKRLNSVIYFDVEISFWLDKGCTKPANIFRGIDGKLMSNLIKVDAQECTSANRLKATRMNLDDFSFFVPQEIMMPVPEQCLIPQVQQRRYYYVVDFTSLGKSLITPQKRAGYIDSGYESFSQCRSDKYALSSWFTYNIKKRNRGFDNAELTERFREFTVNFHTLTTKNDLKVLNRIDGTRHIHYTLSFWEDPEMQLPLYMGFHKDMLLQSDNDFNRTTPYTGFKNRTIPTGYYELPIVANMNDSVGELRRNYLEGVSSNSQGFSIYVSDDIFQDFFAQKIGNWDKDTLWTVYFDINAKLPESQGKTYSHCPGRITFQYKVPKAEEPYQDKSRVVRVETFGKKRIDEDELRIDDGEQGIDEGEPEIGEVEQEIDDEQEEDTIPITKLYTITYIHQDKTFKQQTYKAGATVTPPPAPDTYYWLSVPAKMPSHNIRIKSALKDCEHLFDTKSGILYHEVKTTYSASYGKYKLNLTLINDEENDSTCFYVLDDLITQDLYEHEMDENPSDKKKKSAPVTNIDVVDAGNFCDHLNADLGNSCELIFRVPTIKEWLFVAEQDTILGKELMEIVADGAVPNTGAERGRGDILLQYIGCKFGTRDAEQMPAIKMIKQLSSPQVGLRLVAEKKIEYINDIPAEEIPVEDLPDEHLKVSTKKHYSAFTTTKLVKDYYEYQECCKCGLRRTSKD